MATALQEKKNELDAKSAALMRLWDASGPDRDMSKITELDGDSKAKLDTLMARDRELVSLHDEVVQMERVEDAANRAKGIQDGMRRPVNSPVFAKGNESEQKAAVKTMRQILDESEEYKAFRANGGGTVKFELSEAETKTLLTLGDINNPASRAPGIRSSAQEERTVRDLILSGTTDNNAMTYMEETTFTNNAAAVSEGAVKPESALDFTERTDNVRKIATWLPATDELLADVSGLQSYIEQRLIFMVRREEERQLLLGSGTAPEIQGMELRTGVQTQAKGADPVFDAIYKGMVKVRNTGFSEPTSLVMHPNDLQDLVLTRTADGLYILGNPGSWTGTPPIWGLEVRETTAQTENTAFIISRVNAQVFQREGITITISTEHSDFFVRNQVAILAEERLALAVYRPAGFAKVTGI